MSINQIMLENGKLLKGDEEGNLFASLGGEIDDLVEAIEGEEPVEEENATATVKTDDNGEFTVEGVGDLSGAVGNNSRVEIYSDELITQNKVSESNGTIIIESDGNYDITALVDDINNLDNFAATKDNEGTVTFQDNYLIEDFEGGVDEYEGKALKALLVEINNQKAKIKQIRDKINLNIDEEGNSLVQQSGSNVAEQLTEEDATSPYEGSTTVDTDDVEITVATDEELSEIVIEDNDDENESITFTTGIITIDLDNTDTYNDADIETLLESLVDVTSATVTGQSEQKASSEWLDTITMGGTTLTFTGDIESIEIYHEDGRQAFTINSAELIIRDNGWRSGVGGTPDNEVTIPPNIPLEVSRLE